MDKKNLTVSYAENKSHCMFHDLLDKNCHSRYLGGKTSFLYVHVLNRNSVYAIFCIEDVCISPLTFFNPVKFFNQILDQIFCNITAGVISKIVTY